MNRDSGVILSAIEKERGLGPPVIVFAGQNLGEKRMLRGKQGGLDWAAVGLVGPKGGLLYFFSVCFLFPFLNLFLY